MLIMLLSLISIHLFQLFQLYGDKYTKSLVNFHSCACFYINDEHIEDALLVANELGSFFSQINKGSHLPLLF